MSFPDTRLPEHIPEMSAIIKNVIGEFDPHLIFTHSAHDRHQDHVAAYQATAQAAHGSLILCFESPSSQGFQADCGVCMERWFKNKLECLAVHADHGKKPYMQRDHILKWSAQRGDMERFELGNLL